MADSPGQLLRYHAGPVLDEQVMSGLLGFIADIFSVDASPLRHIGHDPETVTHGWWLGDELVANISLYPRQLCLAGTEIQALGIQSVGARPAYRSQGLFTDLIQKALAYADARSLPIVFTTDKPDLYLPWGFRTVSERAFAAPMEPAPTRPRYRQLAVDLDSDIALIKDCCSTRAPTSLIASTRDHASAFFMKAMVDREIEILHLPDLDAVVAIKGRYRASLILLDVIAPSMPSLHNIASALGHAGSQAILHLTPDLLCSEYEEIPRPYSTPLMVRGPFAAEGLPIMLSRMRV